MRMRGDIDYNTILHRGISMAIDGQWSSCQHVIVDECQDNDSLQWSLVRLLAKHSDVMLVGDEFQCIHAWRGADPGQMRSLGWPTLPLTKTFRCERAIVELANSIKHVDAKLTTDKVMGNIIPKGDTLSLVRTALEQFEPEDIAILCRYNDQVEAICAELEAINIPTNRNKRVERGPIYWLLRYLANPRSQTARQKASLELAPFLHLTADPLIHMVGGPRPVEHLALMVEQWLQGVGVSYGPAEILGRINLPMSMVWESDLYSKEYSGDTLELFRRENDLHLDGNPGITVITAHASKGLEWPCVFLLMDGKRVNEEECRLFYVGVTRGIDVLVLPGDEGWRNYLKECG
jgi:superfamily I DNA/RNA helicase